MRKLTGAQYRARNRRRQEKSRQVHKDRGDRHLSTWIKGETFDALSELQKELKLPSKGETIDRLVSYLRKRLVKKPIQLKEE